MRVCVAQTIPIIGDLQCNIGNHKKLIELAVSDQADMVMFPELSLTEYEPKLAGSLAASPDDERFDDFQRISDSKQITIGVGIPTTNGVGNLISMLLFQPHRARRTYSKKYLHSDEQKFFVPGEGVPILKVGGTNIALAICYEISVPDHLDTVLEGEPEIYVASVAKTANGVAGAIERLSYIAKTHSMTVLMSNSVVPSDDGECAGKSSVLNASGVLIGQLDDRNEGILVFDTETQELIRKTA